MRKTKLSHATNTTNPGCFVCSVGASSADGEICADLAEGFGTDVEQQSYGTDSRQGDWHGAWRTTKAQCLLVSHAEHIGHGGAFVE